jgi:hypothetical protein
VSNIIPVLLVGRGQYITVSNIIPVLFVQLCTVLSLQVIQE